MAWWANLASQRSPPHGAFLLAQVGGCWARLCVWRGKVGSSLGRGLWAWLCAAGGSLHGLLKSPPPWQLVGAGLEDDVPFPVGSWEALREHAGVWHPHGPGAGLAQVRMGAGNLLTVLIPWPRVCALHI